MQMVTETTQGVRVSVTSFYQEEMSHPENGNYVFGYKVRIENTGGYTVQLLRRHWHLHDLSGVIREVEGEGVAGQQPVLEPGEVHEYISACPMGSSIGKMVGRFQMVRVVDGRKFEAIIPEFTMMVPLRYN